MLDHAGEVPSGLVLEADLCIIGAGAAGITLAREFAGRRERVIVLESGGRRQDAAARLLSEGRVTGRHYFSLSDARTRSLGGTTAAWAGECRPLDPEDFEPHAWIPDSGWPFSRAELDPYYERARSVCRLGDAPFDGAVLLDFGVQVLAVPGDRLRTTCFHYSRSDPVGPPTHFGRTYAVELERAPNLRVVLDATALELETNEAGSRVRAVHVARPDGGDFRVSARRIVLAAGGIENPRLLLLSGGTAGPGASRAGLGNGHGLVGRYFMEHLYLDGAARVEDPSEAVGDLYRSGACLGGHALRGLLQIAPEIRRQEELTNFCASLEPPRSVWGLGAALGMTVAALRGGPVVSPGEKLAAIRRTLLRGNRSAGGGRAFALKNAMEQAPNRDSRVALGNEIDRFGCPRAELDWRLSEIDKRTAHRAHEMLREDLGRAGLRFVSLLGSESDPWPAGLRGARHHMGTTRMHPDPLKGVVNADGRVHGVGNLYVAGSSVFPTSGAANPTFTIVALALRLADHLREG